MSFFPAKYDLAELTINIGLKENNMQIQCSVKIIKIWSTEKGHLI